MIRGCVGCMVLVASVALASMHPVWPILQCIGTVIAFTVTIRFPTAFPFLFPLLLVSGDAYPFTGQLVLQEYDSLLMGSVAGMLFRVQIRRDKISQWLSSNGGLAIATFFLGVSVLISSAIGIAGLPSAPWGDQLSVYFTQWNTLRIAKGYAWGILFAVSMWAVVTCNPDVRWTRAFIAGLHCAMVYVAGVVIVERTLFESWFDFEREYRATGPFFTMHIGDQHIDGFAAIALPFAWAFQQRMRWMQLGSGIFLTVSMLMVAFMTMSRATVLAVVVEILLIALLVWTRRYSIPGMAATLLKVGSIVIGIGLVASTAFAIWKAEAFRGRFETVEEDWGGRVSHWSRILKNDSSTWQWMIGHGIGTLPTRLAKQMGRAVPPLAWNADNGGSIRFQPGWPIYLERYYWPASTSIRELPIHASLEDNGEKPGTLWVIRTYKSVLHSYEQSNQSLAILPGVTVKRRLELNAPEIESKSGWTGVWRPESVSLSIQGEGPILLGNSPTEISSFAHDSSSAPWTFSCDDHLVWRAKNFMVHLISEHGLLGLLAFSGWFAAIVMRVGRNRETGMGSWVFSLGCVAMIGFGIVASFGTLIDTPWITALLIGAIAVAKGTEGKDHGEHNFE